MLRQKEVARMCKRLDYVNQEAINRNVVLFIVIHVISISIIVPDIELLFKTWVIFALTFQESGLY